MILVAGHNLAKSYGDMTVLQDLSLIIHSGDRLGVVGDNGSGKSTLLEIMAGVLTPDNGVLDYSPSLTIGYLAQRLPDATPTVTVMEWLQASQRELYSLSHQLEQLSTQMAQCTGGEQLENLLHHYAMLYERFELRGGHDLMRRIPIILQGLGLQRGSLTRPLMSLSGGERTRVGLATLLIDIPPLLVLDEPTNHLADNAAQWLEEYLLTYTGGLLFASHDRAFLNRIATEILALDGSNHQGQFYPGNYQQYQLHRCEELQRWQDQYRREGEEDRRLVKRLHEIPYRIGHQRAPRDNDKAHYKGKGEWVQQSSSQRIRATEQTLRRFRSQRVAKPPEPWQFAIDLRPPIDSQEPHIAAEHIEFFYVNTEPILRDVSLAVNPRDRILIQGYNGAGKSTLLRILNGELSPIAGSVRHTVPIAYFGQEAGSLHGETVIQAYSHDRAGHPDDLRDQLLSTGLFKPDQLHHRVNALSEGQRRRLEWARLIASESSCLLLDELTNHLAPDLLDELEKALQTFRGSVVVVTHDRWFREQFDGIAYHLGKGRLELL